MEIKIEKLKQARIKAVIAVPEERRATAETEALKRIAARQARFVSRGDNSGTHNKEQALWKAAGVTPGGPWYLE